MSVRPHSCSGCSLHRSFCDFSEELRDALDGLKTTVAYDKGATLFDEGTRCHSVFAICEGKVKLTTASHEGRVLLLRIARPGEMLALAEAIAAQRPYQCSAVAMERATVAVIPRETFIRFIHSYPQAGFALTIALSEQYRHAQKEEKFLAFGETSTVRLARLLVDWSAQDGASVPMHITHNDLAHAIGSTRETVTRVLGTLAHDGLVERSGEGILVRDPHALALLSSPRQAVTSVRDDDAVEEDETDLSMWDRAIAIGGFP